MTDDSTVTSGEVSVNEYRQELLQLVQSIDRPLTVCSFGNRPLVLPGLTVEGVGTVGLPLIDHQATQLIAAAEQAPYGKGTETVVDTEVRRVWQLGTEQFALTNSKWPVFVNALLTDIRSDLGLEDRKLKAHLYKLLLYEQGSFFLPHSDGEKLDGMVATLIIALPSEHEGGELRVTHNGQTTSIQMTGAATGFEISFAAFYSDCQHEVRPVTRGHRLCLVYNVTLTDEKCALNAPQFDDVTKKIATALETWATRQQSPSRPTDDMAQGVKLALTLDHEYTEKGLSFDQLKGTDRTTAEILWNAAEQARCVAHLGLVTRYEQGTADVDDYEYNSRRRGYDSDSDVDYEMGEIFEHSLSVHHWSDRDGNTVAFGEISFDESEIIASTPPCEWNASDEEFEGYTGNAGMTLERWYRRAAIVIWPQANHLEVLSACGTDASIAGLQAITARVKAASDNEKNELRDDGVRLAAAIIRNWNPESSKWSMANGSIETVDRNIFLSLLCELNDTRLVADFIQHVLPKDSKTGVDSSLAVWCNREGWTEVGAALTDTFRTVDHRTVARNATILEKLCATGDRNQERLRTCRDLCNDFVTALATYDSTCDSDNWQIRSIDRKQILTSLISAMISIDARRPLQALVNHTLLATRLYEFTGDHIAALFALESRLTRLNTPNKGVDDWLKKCEEQLQLRTEEEPRPPADLRRVDRLTCDCADCETVRSFLAAPGESKIILPVAQHRRQHLRKQIDDYEIDLAYETQRTGSPYKLVLTKTDASFQKSLAIYERDVKSLADIRRIRKARQENVIPSRRKK